MKSTITKALLSAKGAQAKKAQAILDGLDSHPFLWGMATKLLAFKYQRETGADAKVDPSAFLAWILKNLPAILSLLALLLA